MKKTITPAFAYVRVSGVGQVDGHGPQRQEEAVHAFARSNGFQVVEVFRDAHTGTEEDRPAFSAMVGAVRANGVRHVLVERLDRFAREIGVQVALLALLEREGITLIEASMGRDVTAAIGDDPMARALVNIQGVFHQAEKELLVRKLRKARDARRAADGRCEGPRPFGEDPNRPEEVEAVRHLRRLARKNPKKRRRSLRQIAAELDRLGIRTRSGRPWAPSTVRAVLARR